MAAPAFGAVGTVLSPGSGTSAAIPVPSGVQAGHVVLVSLYKESADSANPVTAPSGFNLIGETTATVSGVYDFSHYLYWKRATGADAGTYTFSWTGSAARFGVASRYTGCITSGSPIDVSASAGTTAATTTTPAVSVTTTGVDRLLVWAVTDDNTASWTPPSGFTERLENAATTLATKEQAAAGSSGSVTGTASTSRSMVAWLVALLPDSPPPPVNRGAGFLPLLAA